jgi:hypothetical protein
MIESGCERQDKEHHKNEAINFPMSATALAAKPGISPKMYAECSLAPWHRPAQLKGLQGLREYRT